MKKDFVTFCSAPGVERIFIFNQADRVMSVGFFNLYFGVDLAIAALESFKPTDVLTVVSVVRENHGHLNTMSLELSSIKWFQSTWHEISLTNESPFFQAVIDFYSPPAC